ncbi:MAG TPA: sulfatase-like hydrolase/transferase [Opitutaceae bacterium]|nr:sulfatase-like hydrolase/transferase [Opitutaceae bacterium]
MTFAPIARLRCLPLVVLFAVALRAAPAPSRPNIVFVLTDDQRWNSLGLTGNPVVKTPEIDRLAAEGTFFPNGTITSAICTPSRACYFLGQYERRHGVNFNSGTAVSPAAWRKSYPVLLRGAGYFTGYVGKNHVPVGPQGYEGDELEKSFDFWYAGHGMLSFYPKRRHAIFKDAKADTQPEVLTEGALSFLDAEGGFIAGAETFLKNRPAEKPFCLTIAFNLPHNAGTSSMEMNPSEPELYRTTYRDQLLTQPIPPTYVAKADIRTPKLPRDVHYAQYRQPSYAYVDTEAELRERQIREYETITGIDRLVGAVRAQLAKLGCAENTVIFFASDHGITHGEFGLGGKALNYDVCLRVPMVVMDPRAPAAARGVKSSAMIQSIDFAPTMLDLAGVPIPATMQGQSFRAALEGRPFVGRSHAFAENLWSTYFGNPRCESARTPEWKYIRYFANDRALFASGAGEGGEGGNISDPIAAAYNSWLTASIRGEKPVYEELFHLSVDPDEVTNLAGDPKFASVLQDLRAHCQSLVTQARGNVDEPPSTVRVRGMRDGRGKAGKAGKAK